AANFDFLMSRWLDDVVIVPALGAPVAFMDFIEKRGCQLVDTTCGDVMKVWKRVRGYAKDGVTSIIHGKADHEETRATASRALGTDGNGHFLVILTLNDAERLCHYIQHGGDKTEFMQHFSGSHSANFDPDLHLIMLGVANQTTMLKGETEEIQRRIREAVIKRDGDDSRFHCFDTICGATQERQDALIDMLGEPMDLMLVVGGYNSSNTAHLVEIAEKELPTFFIRDSSCLRSMEEICHFDLHQHQETLTRQAAWLNPDQATKIGITAGASCPNNLIEETVLKVFELRGISQSELLGAIQPSSQD
ncbi:MAG: 4-hydroxy-3-methylbut-2-enyl diphosphate reductase, partial [Luteolibacter sp.]